jgi:dienelactone hydrolase
MARSDDVFAAAAALGKLPVVDRTRIGAIGFSHGGWTVMWAERSQSRHPEVKLRALVGLYPFCGDFQGFTGSVPTLLLLGAQDDWTPAAPCQWSAGQAKDRGYPVTVVTYPDAGHAFDQAQIRGRVRIADARGGQGATVEYNPKAHADAARQVQAFLAEHLKR